jgi:hypothetical protein
MAHQELICTAQTPILAFISAADNQLCNHAKAAHRFGAQWRSDSLNPSILSLSSAISLLIYVRYAALLEAALLCQGGQADFQEELQSWRSSQ